MFLFFILSLFILLSPHPSSSSWSMGIRSAMAQSQTANVSTDALSFQPSQAWTSINEGVVTTTSGASINYVCAKPCTAIEIWGSLPDGVGADFTLCLDCVGAQKGLPPNSTSVTITSEAATFFASGLTPALHSLQITLNSNTDFIITGIQVTTDNTPTLTTSTTSSSASTSATSTSTTITKNTSTSSSSSSSSTATFDPSNDSALASSSSSHTTAIAIGAAVGVLALALLAGLAFFCIRRRKRRQDRFQAGGKGGWNTRFTRVISWPRSSTDGQGSGPGAQDQEQPSSPMLETFRTSRNLDAEYGLGSYAGGGGGVSDALEGGGFDTRSGFGNVPIGTAPAPAFASTSNLNELRPSEDIERDDSRAAGPPPPRTGTVRTRKLRPSVSQRSAYSTYSDPWDYVDEYYNSEGEEPNGGGGDEDNGGNDSDSSGQGHSYYPNPYSPASSKAERLKANLQISTTRSLSKKRTTASGRKRDTTASAFQTPAVVKNMLSDLNDALKTNADRFAWRKNSVQGGGVADGGSNGGGGGGSGNVPMQFLSPNAAVTSRETRGHRPTRSTDVLI